MRRARSGRVSVLFSAFSVRARKSSDVLDTVPECQKFAGFPKPSLGLSRAPVSAPQAPLPLRKTMINFGQDLEQFSHDLILQCWPRNSLVFAASVLARCSSSYLSIRHVHVLGREERVTYHARCNRQRIYVRKQFRILHKMSRELKKNEEVRRSCGCKAAASYGG